MSQEGFSDLQQPGNSDGILRHLKRAWRRLRHGRPVIVVSGLPRSGTSMVMKMLSDGGIVLVTDGLRKPDTDNPKGYFELEQVKELGKEKSWLTGARGKAVKIISQLLVHLPPQNNYAVLFIRRDLEEVLSSQRAMLIRRGEPADGDDARMAELFEKHLRQVEGWVSRQPNIEVLFLDHGKILENPLQGAQRIAEFLNQPLNIEKMARAVDPKLYRNRRSN